MTQYGSETILPYNKEEQKGHASQTYVRLDSRNV